MDELIEKLADQEHERWSRWMRHLFKNWNEINIDRWKLLMDTPYAELSEYSKESDRKEARKTMEIVGPLIDQLEAENERLLSYEVEVKYIAEVMFQCTMKRLAKQAPEDREESIVASSDGTEYRRLSREYQNPRGLE